jgi:uncharacterized membrane protein
MRKIRKADNGKDFNKGEKMKEVKAKTVSLIAKIVAGVVLITGAVLKWLGIFTACDINELCTVALTLMGLFGTVDLNIALDKFKKKDSEE